ncbi:MAG: hypothetical protein MHMPM18_003304 [Marteilia pararefringens]
MVCCDLCEFEEKFSMAGITFAVIEVLSFFFNGFFINSDLKNECPNFFIVAAVFTFFLVLIFIYYSRRSIYMQRAGWDSCCQKIVIIMALLFEVIIASMTVGLSIEGRKVLVIRSKGQIESGILTFTAMDVLFSIAMFLLLCLHNYILVDYFRIWKREFVQYFESTFQAVSTI